MLEEHMLTTVDNPYDPFTQFDDWNAWDIRNGYHTLAFLARIVKSSSELSDADQSEAIEQAIKEITEANITGMYRAVKRPAEAAA